MTMSKYYLFYRIDDGEWKSVYYRSFLTNESVDKIYGQFVSSSWFSLGANGVSHVDFKVIRMNGVLPTSVYHDTLCEQLGDEDEPESVVACERFDLTKIRKHLNLKFMSDDQDQMIYQELRSTMGATFHMIRSGPESVEYMMSCPTFVIAKN